MKKLKDLLKTSRLNLKELMEAKAGQKAPIDDCGNQLCSGTACTNRSYEACSGTDCPGLTCGGSACSSYA